MQDRPALDIRPLENAILALTSALDHCAQNPDEDLIRDGCIQRFEFTYELSHKMLRRFLEATSANPEEIDAMSFQDLIRTGSERGVLLSDWSHWKRFLTARSITSHFYNESQAREVFAIIPEFLEEARHLQDLLRRSI